MDSAVVAGGGLAGLVAARHLADAGVDVTVIERRDEVGGRVRTAERDGHLCDRGFQVLFPAYPAAKRELDLDALDLRRFRPGAVLARASDGRRSVLSDPLRDPGAAVETLLNREITLGDKIRTLRLRRDVRGRNEQETFGRPDRSIRAELERRGFSERFIENFIAPFYGGITLDRSLATSKRVFEYTFRTLSESRAAVPADGMRAVPAQLRERAAASGATLVTGERVTGVDAESDGVTVATADRTVEADAAVVATDPKTARDLTGVDAVPTAGRGCVTQHYALDRPLDTGERIVCNVEGPTPNTVAPMGAVAPEYAPDDGGLLAATFLPHGERDPFDRSDEELRAETAAALDAWFPERRFDLSLLGTDRIPFAQFAQPPGVHDDLPTADAPAGAVYLAGDYTAWSSIQGALRSGRDAARAALD